MDFSRRIYTRRQWGDFCREWNEEKKRKKQQNQTSNIGCLGKGDSFPIVVAIDEEDQEDDSPADEIIGGKPAVSVEEEEESDDELKKSRKRRRRRNGVIGKNSSFRGRGCGEVLLKSSKNVNKGLVVEENIGNGSVDSEKEDENHVSKDEMAGKIVGGNPVASVKEKDCGSNVGMLMKSSRNVKEGIMGKENIGNGSVGSEGEGGDEAHDQEMEEEGYESRCHTSNEKISNSGGCDDGDHVPFLDNCLTPREIMLTNRVDDDDGMNDGDMGNSMEKNDEKVEKKMECSNGDGVRLMAVEDNEEEEEDDDDVTWIAKEDIVINSDHHQRRLDKQIKKSKCNVRNNNALFGIAFRLRTRSASQFTIKGNSRVDSENEEENRSSKDEMLGEILEGNRGAGVKEKGIESNAGFVGCSDILLKSSKNVKKGIMGKEKTGNGNVTSEGEGEEVFDHEMEEEGCEKIPNHGGCDGGGRVSLDNRITSRVIMLTDRDDDEGSKTYKFKKKMECSNGNGACPMDVEDDEDDDVTWIAKEDFVIKQKIDKKKKKSKCNIRTGKAHLGIAFRLRSCSVPEFTIKKKKPNKNKNNDSPIKSRNEKKHKNVKNSSPASKEEESKKFSFYEAIREGKHAENHNGKKRKRVKCPHRMKMSKCGKKDFELKKMILDSLWGDAGITTKKLSFSKENVKGPLPLKFWLEDEDPSPPEKSKWEKDIESLFADLQSSLEEVKESLTTEPMAEDDCSNSEENEDDPPAVCCKKGKHFLILDEQIGLICKHCSLVHRERRFILPSFAIKTGGRRYAKCFDGYDNTFGYGLPSGAAGSPHCSSISDGGGTVWDVLPRRSKETMYPHQREGFEFLWRNIAGDIHIENLKKLTPDGGQGCIISHAPGTGKTRLTITFLFSFMKLFPTCRPLIIAPLSMLLTWEAEFKKWEVDIPFHNMNNHALSGREFAHAADGFALPYEPKGWESKRVLKLCAWARGSGILGISYRLFEQLVRVNENREDDRVRKILLKVPSLVVLDEGHTPRNDGSLLWNALSRLETSRRIILSGTPFQNNFDELYNTLRLVCPKYVLKRNSGKKIWDRLTTSIMEKEKNPDVGELKSIIAPLVHVHKGSILLDRLPGLRSTLVYLNPTPLQQRMFLVTPQKKFFEEDNLMTRISVHPSLVKDVPGFSEFKPEMEAVELDPDAGPKTEFVFALIRLSHLNSEKVIVFSQYLSPLDLLKKQMEAVLDWVEGREVLYMDGDVQCKQRQVAINTFNDPGSEAKVLLASTRACSEGINLIGASRVVLLDVVWNPSVKRQALSRAYRLGQTKVVHVYHLISSTMEAKKFSWQAKKDLLSELVFSTSDGVRGGGRRGEGLRGSEDRILEAIVRHPKHGRIFDRMVHNPNESDSIDTFDFVE
ncbi:hypothetical protein DM860_015825 [Cuscuta australis]|uniref:Uncharacterized protein n=1 Tax=Cuscuta australis TaxID=267555 RepID=A0A328E1M8_9ASTE|nr:hypothetical protein DM860_015825 [Cuscuta australis]